MDWASLSDDDRQSIQGAYDTLTRLGNETAAADGGWDDFLDKAQQDLGVILALHLGARWLAERPGRQSSP